MNTVHEEGSVDALTTLNELGHQEQSRSTADHPGAGAAADAYQNANIRPQRSPSPGKREDEGPRGPAKASTSKDLEPEQAAASVLDRATDESVHLTTTE